MSKQRKVVGVLNAERKRIGGQLVVRGDILLQAVVPDHVTLDKLTMLTKLGELGWLDADEVELETTAAAASPARGKKKTSRRGQRKRGSAE